jgi:hypothetical protein
MDAVFGGGYGFVLVLWGVVFIVGAIGFIYGMNLVFQSEQRREDVALGSTNGAHAEDRPMRPPA